MIETGSQIIFQKLTGYVVNTTSTLFYKHQKKEKKMKKKMEKKKKERKHGF